MPKISELDTGTVTSAGKIAVAQGDSTIQATIADIGAAAGGGVNRYTLTSGGLNSGGNISSLGTGITVPPGVSIVIILGMESNASYGSFPSGASIPHNTGNHSWGNVQYLQLNGSGTGSGGLIVTWGMPPAISVIAPVDNKIYVNGGQFVSATSLTLMFI